MNVGFESEQSANNELQSILRERKRHNLSDEQIVEMQRLGMHIPSVCIGTDWKIEPIKLKKI